MTKKFLVSTPIKLTWPKLKNNILIFNSEAAILKYKGDQKKYKKYYINKFRWKDKKILGKDLKYLSGFNSMVSKKISNIENDIRTNKENFCLVPFDKKAERIAIPKSSRLVSIMHH